MRFPEQIRRAFQRSSVGLAVAGLAVVVSSITTLAAMGGDDSGGRPAREMTLSAIEDDETTTTSSSASTTTTTERPAIQTAPVELGPVDEAPADGIEEQLANHEVRIGRLEATTTTTAAMTSSTVAKYAPVVEEPTTTTTRPPTIQTTTTTAPPRGEWVEVTRFEGVHPAYREIQFQTGYVRCRHLRNGEADPEVVQRPALVGDWRDMCVSAGSAGEVSPVVNVGVRTLNLRVVHRTYSDWDFGTAVDEWRCIDQGCPMPKVG